MNQSGDKNLRCIFSAGCRHSERCERVQYCTGNARTAEPGALADESPRPSTEAPRGKLADRVAAALRIREWDSADIEQVRSMLSGPLSSSAETNGDALAAALEPFANYAMRTLEIEGDGKDNPDSKLVFTNLTYGHFRAAVNAMRGRPISASAEKDTVTVPRRVAELIRKVCLPHNPNKCRGWDAEALAAVRTFIASVDGSGDAK